MPMHHNLKVPALAPDRICPDVQALVQEHGALVRQMAGLQERVSGQLQAQARQVAALEGEVLRLRGHLVVARTCLLWRLPHEGLASSRPLRRQTPLASLAPSAAHLAEASTVICQTGCVGHAHPWLDGDGQCRRTGLVCGPLAAASSGRAAPVLPMVVDLKP